jgi:CRISPR-associated endonuclease/helicase Cas3
MEYIAHIRDRDGGIQTVQEHLSGVQKLSEKFGDKIGIKHLAGLVGLLHDLGKNSVEFKEYIQEAASNPEKPPRRGSVDHSTAGGKLLYRRFYKRESNEVEKLVIEWAAMSIISHHQGLRDFLTPELSSSFLDRVALKKLDEYETSVTAFFDAQISESEFERYFEKAKDDVMGILPLIKKPIASSLLIKYLFSCLIDADRTNTRMFEENEQENEMFDHHAFFESSYTSLMEKIDAFDQSEGADHPINVLRSEMSRQCDEFAVRPSGIYTLSIPTGGGKTLASLRYALRHALTYGKERIVYIVPYTTIIEQNAQEVRDIIKNDQYILEHHSNVAEHEDIFNNLDHDETYDRNAKKLKLAKDNWESPIIFTTMVQFLNTFYAKGTRNVRRLHQLTNAVIIFDEVQTVPIKCASLFNEAVNFLYTFGKSSVVLCTATQPALGVIEHNLKISTYGEMVKDIHHISESFKRVNVIDRTTPRGFGAAEISQLINTTMNEVSSTLIILNTKTAVRKLFDELSAEHNANINGYTIFHLSTGMCAAHRKDVLANLKDALRNRQRVVCVSTQLIEAGVDISFDCVIRSLAGLDSIAQAAGRCNRHGKDESRNVYIIKAADEVLNHLKEIKIGADITKRVLDDFKKNPEKFEHDLLSQSSIKHYFKYYFKQVEGEFDYPILEIKKTAFDLLNANRDLYSAYRHKHGESLALVSRQSFATAEGYFNVIDSPTKDILVPYNEKARNLILELNGDMDTKKLGSLLKTAQQFVISIYEHELRKLEKNGDIYMLLHGKIHALREVAYSEYFGLELEGDGQWSAAFQ